MKSTTTKERIFEALKSNPVYLDEGRDESVTIEKLIVLRSGEVCPAFENQIWFPQRLYFVSDELFCSAMMSSPIELDTIGYTLEEAVRNYNQQLQERLYIDTSVDETMDIVEIINIADLDLED